MPRLTQSLPKYRKHRASGQAVVTLNGKDCYLGPHGTKASKHEYDRLIGEWIANGRHLVASMDEGLTITEALALYWKFAKRHYVKNGRPTDEQHCIKSAVKPLKELYGHTPARRFGPLALKAIMARMVKDEWSRGYVNKSAARIKRFFRWCVSEQLIPPAVHQALQTVDGLRKGKSDAHEPEPVRPVKNEVVEATLPYLPKDTADMVRLQRLCGMRPGEVCAMRPSDVDCSTSPWRYVPSEHKMEHVGRQRVVFVGPKAQRILKPYLLRDSESLCFPIDARQYWQRIRTAVNRANKVRLDAAESAGVKADAVELVPHWAPNQLRHARATEIRKRFGLEAAQVTLGHAAADVTQVYAERDLEKAASIMAKIG